MAFGVDSFHKHFYSKSNLVKIYYIFISICLEHTFEEYCM